MIFSLVSILFILILIPWIISFRNKEFDFFMPLHFVGILYFLYFGLRTIYLLISPSAVTSSNLFPEEEIFVAPLIFSIVSYLLLLIGYYSPVSKKIISNIPSFSDHWYPRRMKLAFYLCIAVGSVFIFINSFILGRFYTLFADESDFAPGTWLGFLGFGEKFLIFGAILGSICIFTLKESKTLLLLWLIAVLSFLISQSLLVGSKQLVLLALLYLVIPMHYLRKSISPKHLVLIGCIVILFFPLTYILRMPAGIIGRTSFDVSLVAEDIGFVVDKLKEFSVSEFLEFTASSFMNRFAGIDAITLIMSSPNVEGGWNDKYSSFLFPVMWIPRALWPDKPIPNMGVWFGYEFWGLTNPTEISVMRVGEMFLLFGWWGILGMVVYGIMYRTFYLYLVGKKPNKIGVFLYPFFYIYMLQIETWIGFKVVDLIETTLVALIISRWINRGTIFSNRVTY